jgi:hypothetical protein
MGTWGGAFRDGKPTTIVGGAHGLVGKRRRGRAFEFGEMRVHGAPSQVVASPIQSPIESRHYLRKLGFVNNVSCQCRVAVALPLYDVDRKQ